MWKQICIYIQIYWRGIVDALKLKIILKIIKNRHNESYKMILNKMLECIKFNGLIFILSIIVNEYILFRSLPSSIFLLTWSLYYLFWIYPIFILGFFLNGIWYRDIAKIIFSKINPAQKHYHYH